MVARHRLGGQDGAEREAAADALGAGNAVLDVILAPGFLDGVQARGRTLTDALHGLVEARPDLFEAVRGHENAAGLMVGLKCRVPVAEIQAAALAEQLLAVGAGDDVLRLVPPLVVSDAQCLDAVERLSRAAERVRPRAGADRVPAMAAP